jgi:NMD protein affecting ribosome stability and mRNA decay
MARSKSSKPCVDCGREIPYGAIVTVKKTNEALCMGCAYMRGKNAVV